MAARLIFDASLVDPKEVLSELTLRLAGRSHLQAPEGYPIICVGALPRALPMELAIPSVGRVIGTIIRSPDEVQVYAEIEDAPERVVAFYDDHMLKVGWKRVETFDGLGGFAPGPPQDLESATYCRSAIGPALYLSAWGSGTSKSDVILRLDPEHHGLCDPEARERMQMHHGLRGLIPTLYPPPGTWKSGGGGGGGPDHWHSSAILETEMLPSDVMKHYAGQLEKANWARLGTLERGATIVSYWEFESQGVNPCIGFLDVKMLEARPGLRYLHILASRLDHPTDRPAWVA